MKAKMAVLSKMDSYPLTANPRALGRRAFLRQSLVLAGGCAVYVRAATAGPAPEPLKPVGVAKGIHPGRVAWVHDPEVTDWKGPGDGHWWEGNRVKQERVDAMMGRALCDLTGETSVAGAWSRLFRHLNESRGKGPAGYSAGERIAIKPNWVGMIYREGHVDLDTCTFISAARLHEHLAADDHRPVAPARQCGRAPGQHHGLRHPRLPGERVS